MRLHTLPAALLLTLFISSNTFAQNPFKKGPYAYDWMLSRFVDSQAALMEETFRQDSGQLSAVFSPCTVPSYSFVQALDSSRYNYNQALAQKMNELLMPEYRDTAKRNALMREIDTVVSFNAFSRDINSVAQRYSSSKLIYEACLSFRRQSGLSTRLDDPAPLPETLPVTTIKSEHFVLVTPVLLDKDDVIPPILGTLAPSPATPGTSTGTSEAPDPEQTVVMNSSTPKVTRKPGDSALSTAKKDTVKGKETQNDTVKPVVIKNPDIKPDPAPWSMWKWLLYGTGVFAAATNLYIFVYWFYRRRQHRFKVILIPMNSGEKRLMQRLLKNAEHTPGFSVGYITERDMRGKIQRRNILYRIPDTETQYIDTPGAPRTLIYKREYGRFDTVAVKSAPRREGHYRHTPISISLQPGLLNSEEAFPAYYILWVDSPLLPSHARELEENLIDIIQYLPVNNYIINVTSPQLLEKMRNGPGFRFVKSVLPYTVNDIGFFTTGRQLDGPLILDVLLHAEKDTELFMGRLRSQDINIIAADGPVIRVILGTASYELATQRLFSKYVQAVYEYQPPQLYNDRAALITGCLSPAGVRTTPYTGKGEIIAIADTGIDHELADFDGKLAGFSSLGRKTSNDCSDQHGHGTHVAGTIAGTGAASGGAFKGVAFGAKLFIQSLLNKKEPLGGLPHRLAALFQDAYDNGARIHNNSWGVHIGSVYEGMAFQADRFVYKNKDFLIVMAAGNEGNSRDVRHVEKGYTDLFSITAPGTARNVLTVGASRSDRTVGGLSVLTWSQREGERFPDPPIAFEKVSGDPEALAADSSRGPCWDGDRLKPDIVAPGTDILSTRSRSANPNIFHGLYSNDNYAYWGGTSMATPVVAGAAALVREYYRERWGYKKPSAALIRATIINGTRRLTAPDAVHGNSNIPNYNQGFGMLDVSQTIPADGNRFYFHFWDTLNDASFALKQVGDSFKVRFTLAKRSWLRLCLAYTDRPAKGVQLEFAVSLAHDMTGSKWQGNGDLLKAYQYKKEYDHKNNVAIIRLEDAWPGDYTIKVLAWTVLPPYKGEHFALVLTSSDNGLAVKNAEMEQV